MTKWVWGYLYWGLLWLLVGFLASELLAYFQLVPWPVLTDTTRHAIKTYKHEFVGPLLFAVFIFLIVHMIYDRPVWHAATFGLAIAFVSYFLDKRL